VGCFRYIIVNILYKSAEIIMMMMMMIIIIIIVDSFLNSSYTCIAGIVTRLLGEQPRSHGPISGRVKKFCRSQSFQTIPGTHFTMRIYQASKLKMRELYLYPVTPYSFVACAGTDLPVERTYNNNLQQIITIDT